MACLLVLFAAFFPRLAVLMLWIARPVYVHQAFGSSFLLPVLGILFLPFTTLMYLLLYTPGIGLFGFDWLWIGIAVLLDVGNWTASAARGRRVTA